MHINVNFCINFVRTQHCFTYTMIAQSAELSQRVKHSVGHSKERWVSV